MTDKRSEDIAEITIDGVTSEGWGVGRMDGLAVFVSGALPGERVRARIVARKKRFALAETERVLSSVPGRVKPSCPDYDSCGGCSLQHADYRTELELKRRIVQQSLRRLGGQEIETPLPLAAAQPAFYRNRAVLHYKDGLLGFYNENSHSVTPRDDCELLMPALNELLARLQAAISDRGTIHGLRGVGLRCDESGERLLLSFICDRSISILTDVAESLSAVEPRLVSVWENSGPPVYGVYGADWRLLTGQSRLRDHIGPVRLDLSPGSFLQVNPVQTVVLYDLVRSYACLSGSENVLDI
ncbi:MAG: class I SAM-dependent RNA methyltransferase [Firmicutes bacterium]|nr:class I SAM-dependent RNA methyltransferase [Bacillota bacterium]